jgi:hypothetical protein
MTCPVCIESEYLPNEFLSNEQILRFGRMLVPMRQVFDLIYSYGIDSNNLSPNQNELLLRGLVFTVLEGRMKS